MYKNIIEMYKNIEIPEPKISSKVYRTYKYEIHDYIYSIGLSNLYKLEDENMKINFNKFTDNLMDEQFINRYALLRAIYYYRLSPNGITYPPSDEFEKTALIFNTYK
jgi:hypothetical protein